MGTRVQKTMTLAALHELLCDAASPKTEEALQKDKEEAKKLLQEYGDKLLRTLETSPSPDQPGGATAHRPAFPTPASGAAPSDAADKLVSALANVDKEAAHRLLSDYKSEAYNDHEAFVEVANAPPPALPPAPAPTSVPALPAPAPAAAAPSSLFGAASAAAAPSTAVVAATSLAPAADVPDGPSTAQLLAALPAELRLLQFVHEQRLLLLRCVHQLLVIVYQNPQATPLFNVACGSVAILLQALPISPSCARSVPVIRAAHTHGPLRPTLTDSPHVPGAPP